MTATRLHRTTAFTGVLLITYFFVLSTDPSAQQRRAVRRAAAPVVVLRSYYPPFMYDPWYYPFYPYGWYPPYAFGAGYLPDSSMRLQVSPRQTEVFVDGYYAGTVDDFDGLFQRLRLDRGEHEITLYLQGYRAVRQSIYLQPGGTFRIRHTMEPLPAGAAQDPRPAPPPRPPRRDPNTPPPDPRS